MPNLSENRKKQIFLEKRQLFFCEKIVSKVVHEHLIEYSPDTNKNTLAMIFSTCPHLFHLSQIYAGQYLKQILSSNWKTALKEIKRVFEQNISSLTDEEEATQTIRLYKNQSNYVIAMSELLGFMSIEDSCKQLSDLGEYTIQKTLNFLFRQAGIKSPKNSGFTILALGKLGAKELNYSSDLDLIFLHKTNNIYDNKKFIELGKKLIHMLSTPSKIGNGWRIDMRLRPNPSTTSVSLDINTAIIYYESIARSWERAAFLRARPIAGDLKLAEGFLSKIEPFIWRNTLDYTVVEDLQNWLRHYPIPKDYLGFDVKLGAFGIRHVEIITHVLQLLGGGRNLSLRTQNTSNALIELESYEWISEGKANDLISCYYAWRRIEHRLQYQRDNQTHKLPKLELDFEKFSYLMGYRSSLEFKKILHELQQFTKISASHPILDEMVSKKANINSTSVTLPQDPEFIIEWISQLGFKNEKFIQKTIQGWLSGSVAATSSERARTYLIRLLPKMFLEIAKADFPDAAFAAFQDIISSLPAGVQIFALLENNPILVSLLSNILVKAPRLTEILRYNTYLLDDLLENQFFHKLPDKTLVAKIIQDEIKNVSIERALDLIRKRNRSWQFQADVHLLEEISEAHEIAYFRSIIASECLCQINQLALKDFTTRHGFIENNFEIIALGRLADCKLTAQSDLDLIFVYDNDNEKSLHNQIKMDTSSYFIRLTQLINNWMTFKTSHGSLYELDLRLRPDGNAGPLAVSMERFSSYYENEAWIWEFFALRNARLLLNGNNFSDKIVPVLKYMQSRVFKSNELKVAFAEILNKRKAEIYPLWNLKQQHGGLLDCSIAQYMLGTFEKKYPLISNKLNQIHLRLDTLIQQLSTRLVSYHHNELPKRVIHFIAIQLNYENAETLKRQVTEDFRIVTKILTILFKDN